MSYLHGHEGDETEPIQPMNDIVEPAPQVRDQRVSMHFKTFTNELEYWDSATFNGKEVRDVERDAHDDEDDPYPDVWWKIRYEDDSRDAIHNDGAWIEVVNPIYEPEFDPRLPTRCACCNLYIGERDEQNPALCANCGAYVSGLKAAQDREIENLRARIGDLEAKLDAKVEILNHVYAERDNARDDAAGLREAVEHILYTADASADGHDEINEDTPEAYIKLLEGRLMLINRIAKAVLNGEDWTSV